MSLAITEAAFSKEELERQLVKCVVCGNYPFTFVEDPNVRSLLRLLKPGLRVPSATTIKDRTMETYKDMKLRIADRLCNAGSRISLTLDCWTSPNTKAFLGITVIATLR